jgi:hypothetical protein
MKKFVALFLATATIAAFFLVSSGKAERAYAAPYLGVTIYPSTVSGETFAIMSLTSRYTPYEKGYWASAVCEGMTQVGCQNFLQNDAGAFWDKVVNESDGSVATSAQVFGRKPVSDTVEVWRVKVIRYYGEDKTDERELYAVVVKDGGKWLVDSVYGG